MTNYHGFDTETPLGDCRLIATDIGYKEVETFEEVLSFFHQKKYRASKMFTFNLKFDVNAILKLTNDREFLNELLEFPGWKGLEYKNTGAFLKYIPGKFFKISYKHGSVTFTDMSPFYDFMGLETASQKFLCEGKHDVDAHLIGSLPGYYDDHRQEIIDYCIQDARLTLKLGLRVKGLIESCQMPQGKLSFRNPISSAKIAELYEKDLGKTAYPSVKIGKVIPVHHNVAHHAFHGGMFQTFKRGFIDQDLFHYDINSAYPSVMKDLPHWANGRFEVVKQPDIGDYGWYFCEFNCEWMPFNDVTHPYVLTQELGEEDDFVETVDIVNPKRKLYPKGVRSQWITKAEYEWMLKNNYRCEFRYGIEWFKLKDEYDNPFFWIPEVYKRRKELKLTGDETQYALKIVMNGIYGKTAQFKHGMGPLTNFFYASYITAKTRLQVADVANRYPDNILEIATDSVLLDRKVDVPLSEKLGEWGLNEYRRGILIGSGMHQFWYKHKPGFVTHARGLTDLRSWDMESAMYKWKSYPYVCFEKTRPIQLREMLTHTKVLKFSDLGIFTPVRKHLKVNTDKKRKWPREYTTILDFINSEVQSSEPLTVERGELTN